MASCDFIRQCLKSQVQYFTSTGRRDRFREHGVTALDAHLLVPAGANEMCQPLVEEGGCEGRQLWLEVPQGLMPMWDIRHKGK